MGDTNLKKNDTVLLYLNISGIDTLILCLEGSPASIIDSTQNLIRFEILGLLINTLTANNEYLHHNRKSLPLSVLMQLSKTAAIFCSFFCIFRTYIAF